MVLVKICDFPAMLVTVSQITPFMFTTNSFLNNVELFSLYKYALCNVQFRISPKYSFTFSFMFMKLVHLAPSSTFNVKMDPFRAAVHSENLVQSQIACTR